MCVKCKGHQQILNTRLPKVLTSQIYVYLYTFFFYIDSPIYGSSRGALRTLIVDRVRRRLSICVQRQDEYFMVYRARNHYCLHLIESTKISTQSLRKPCLIWNRFFFFFFTTLEMFTSYEKHQSAKLTCQAKESKCMQAFWQDSPKENTLDDLPCVWSLLLLLGILSRSGRLCSLVSSSSTITAHLQNIHTIPLDGDPLTEQQERVKAEQQARTFVKLLVLFFLKV